MSKIKIERSHDKGLEWAKSKAEEVNKVLSKVRIIKCLEG